MEDGKISPDELKSLSKIKEARGKSIVFTFGRFNPPTIGHGKLLDKMNSVRADVKRVYLSKSEDSDKNPLKFRQKIALMKRMFPRYANQIVTSNSNQIFEIATELYRQNFTEIFMVVGSDRVREFETTLNKYNNVRARHGYYNFDNINVLSAGERDPDAEGATGMSASKMRAAAKTNNFTKFKQGLPSSFARTKDAEDMFKQVRKGMNLAASYGYDGGAGALRFKPFITASTKEELDNMVLRDKYITEHLYDVGDIVDDVSNNTTGIIIRRGTNYVTLEDADMKLSKAWLYDIVETPVVTDAMAERAKKIAKHKYKRDPKYYDKGGSIKKSPEDKETGLPKKYVKGLSKDKAKQHKAQLDRQSKMRDDDPAAYRQTTADKGAKTKPSKYTKKFKQMYGELKTSKDTDPTLMPTGVPEAYDMGHDYAKYTSSITPGEKHYSASFQGTTYKPSNPKDNLINVNAEKDNEMKKKVELKDIEEWANDKDTIDKYKERYGEDWQSKIEETYEKMFSKVIDSNENMLEGRMKDIAIDLMSKEKGGLDADEFKRKYNKSKAEMQKDLGTPPNMPKKSFKEFAEDVNEWGVFPSMIVEAEYQGKKVKLNDPIRTSENPNKKFKVYVKDGDTVKVVRFGDPNMSIKRDDPARLKNFRARHNCDNPGPKTKARYWSCFQWRAGAKVDN